MSTIDGVSGGWTYERYYALDDEQRYEVIDGELLMVPGPGTFHQSILGELFVRLRTFALDKRMGTVFVSPLDVVLDDINVVQPDVLFIRNDHLEIIDPRAIRGVPDLVVEILSPGTRRRDRALLLQRVDVPGGEKREAGGDRRHRQHKRLMIIFRLRHRGGPDSSAPARRQPFRDQS